MAARILIRRSEAALIPVGFATGPAVAGRRSKKIVSSGICDALCHVLFSSTNTQVSAVTRWSRTQFVRLGSSTGPYATLSTPHTRYRGASSSGSIGIESFDSVHAQTRQASESRLAFRTNFARLIQGAPELALALPSLLAPFRRLTDRRGARAAVRVAFEAFEDRLLQRRGNVLIEFARQNEVETAVQLLSENILRCITGKWFPAGEQFVGGDAIREDVHAMIDRLPADLFRRHVRRRAGILGHLSGFIRFRLGQVKIHQTQTGIAREQHILRLEVQMHEPALVDMLERERHVDQDVANVLGEDWIGARVEQFQVRAFDILHQQIEVAINFSVALVSDHVMVIMDFGEDFASAQETPFGCEIEARVVVQQ